MLSEGFMPYFSDSKTTLDRLVGGGNESRSARKSPNYKRLSESASKNVSKIIEIATIAFHLIALGIIVTVGVSSMYTNIGFLLATVMSGCCVVIAGMMMPLALIINDPERDNTFSRFFARNYIVALILDIGSTIIAAIFSFAVFYKASLSLSPTQLLPLEWVLLVTGGSIISACITACAATAAAYGLYKCANYAVNRYKTSKKSKRSASLEQGIEMGEIARPTRSSDVTHHTTVHHTVGFSRQAQQLSPAVLEEPEPGLVAPVSDDARVGKLGLNR